MGEQLISANFKSLNKECLECLNAHGKLKNDDFWLERSSKVFNYLWEKNDFFYLIVWPKNDQ